MKDTLVMFLPGERLAIVFCCRAMYSFPKPFFAVPKPTKTTSSKHEPYFYWKSTGIPLVNPWTQKKSEQLTHKMR